MLRLKTLCHNSAVVHRMSNSSETFSHVFMLFILCNKVSWISVLPDVWCTWATKSRFDLDNNRAWGCICV
jgi:hypothetical protein